VEKKNFRVFPLIAKFPQILLMGKYTHNAKKQKKYNALYSKKPEFKEGLNVSYVGNLVNGNMTHEEILSKLEGWHYKYLNSNDVFFLKRAREAKRLSNNDIVTFPKSIADIGSELKKEEAQELKQDLLKRIPKNFIMLQSLIANLGFENLEGQLSGDLLKKRLKAYINQCELNFAALEHIERVFDDVENGDVPYVNAVFRTHQGFKAKDFLAWLEHSHWNDIVILIKFILLTCRLFGIDIKRTSKKKTIKFIKRWLDGSAPTDSTSKACAAFDESSHLTILSDLILRIENQYQIVDPDINVCHILSGRHYSPSKSDVLSKNRVVSIDINFYSSIYN
jgi:hypothetical protein